jgi:hypothetical protein
VLPSSPIQIVINLKLQHGQTSIRFATTAKSLCLACPLLLSMPAMKLACRQLCSSNGSPNSMCVELVPCSHKCCLTCFHKAVICNTAMHCSCGEQVMHSTFLFEAAGGTGQQSLNFAEHWARNNTLDPAQLCVESRTDQGPE